jgi:hypothetical protein
MTKAPHICFDRLLPQELSRPRPTRRMATGRVRAITPKGKQWVNGSALSIQFMDGTRSQ